MIIKGTLQHKKTGWQIQSKTGIMQLEMILKKYKDKKVIVMIEGGPSDTEIVLSKLCSSFNISSFGISNSFIASSIDISSLHNFEYIGW